jgi:chromate reductase
VSADLLLLCGSLREGSSNHAVLRTAATLMPAGQRAAIFEGIGRLPHFNPDDDHAPLPEAVAELRAAIDAASAVLISTPEYAGALPGSFKNALDWTIGGGEIYGKPIAWINASGPAAPTGGADAHDSLRKVLTYAGTNIVEPACRRIPIQRSDVSADGLIHDEELRTQIAACVTQLLGASPAG